MKNMVKKKSSYFLDLGSKSKAQEMLANWNQKHLKDKKITMTDILNYFLETFIKVKGTRENCLEAIAISKNDDKRKTEKKVRDLGKDGKNHGSKHTK